MISFKNSIKVNIKTQEAVKNRAIATIRRFKTSEGVTVANKVATERAEKQLSDAEEKKNSYYLFNIYIRRHSNHIGIYVNFPCCFMNTLTFLQRYHHLKTNREKNENAF